MGPAPAALQERDHQPALHIREHQHVFALSGQQELQPIYPSYCTVTACVSYGMTCMLAEVTHTSLFPDKMQPRVTIGSRESICSILRHCTLMAFISRNIPVKYLRNKNATTCDVHNDMLYTYNQGVILSGLRGL
jgi:hypothetical protein